MYMCIIKPINLIQKNSNEFRNLILNMSWGEYSHYLSVYAHVNIIHTLASFTQKNIIRITGRSTLLILFFFLSSSYQVQNCSFIHSHSQNNIIIFQRIENMIVLSAHKEQNTGNCNWLHHNRPYHFKNNSET